MPTKCPFCQPKYSESGAYQKYVQTAHANLDLILECTLEYPSSVYSINELETNILHNPEASEVPDSDYESNADATAHELDTFTAHESATEIPADSTSSLPGIQDHHPPAGEAT